MKRNVFTLLPVLLVFALMVCFIERPKALTIEEYKAIKEEVKNEYIWFNDADIGRYNLSCDEWMEFSRKESGKTFREQSKEEAYKCADIAAYQLFVHEKACLPK